MSEKKVFWDVEEIMKKIPHRFPFLLIDRVDSYQQGPDKDSYIGAKIIARKNVTVNEPYFVGHFPHKPVMPGVLQIEAMAQAGALAAMVGRTTDMDVLFAKIDGARFRKPVVPGDTLEIHAEIKKEKAGILGVSCKTFCDGEVVAEVDIMAKVFPRSESV